MGIEVNIIFGLLLTEEEFNRLLDSKSFPAGADWDKDGDFYDIDDLLEIGYGNIKIFRASAGVYLFVDMLSLIVTEKLSPLTAKRAERLPEFDFTALERFKTQHNLSGEIGTYYNY